MILLAIGVDDVIQLLFLLVFFIGPLIMQVFKGGEKKPQPRKARRPQQPAPQPRPQPRPQRRPAAPRNPAETLDAEIEQFLRRASGRQPAQHAEVIEVVEAEVLDDVYHGETIEEHVRKHISVDDVTEHSADFGRSVTDEVQELDQHVKDVFEHQVGSIESSSPSGDSKRPVAESSAARIRRLLGDPNSVKDAVILQEILRRPEY